MQLHLPPPLWEHLTGGSTEAAWLADRDRKLTRLLTDSDDILHIATALDALNATFDPSPELLRKYPFAIEWYVSLAGLALKTLRNVKDAPRAYGVKTSVDTLRKSLVAGRSVDHTQLMGLADWLREEIDHLWPIEQRSTDRAAVIVAAILGGRAIGQGQNDGGNEAVVLLKEAIITYATSLHLQVEGETDGGWVANSPEQPSLLLPSLRVGKKLIADFYTGGDTPDVIFRVDTQSKPVAVGEVKGRKDKSNIWESWMPQVVDHMYTWTQEYPLSLRLMFGTVITDEMVEGISARGTVRRGLRYLHQDGSLHGVHNLSKLTQNDSYAVQSFSELMSALLDA